MKFTMRQRLAIGARLVVLAVVALATAIPVPAQLITTFDVLGAGTGSGQGTRGTSINEEARLRGFIKTPVTFSAVSCETKTVISPPSMCPEP